MKSSGCDGHLWHPIPESHLESPQCGFCCLIPKGLRWRSCWFNPNFKRKMLRDYYRVTPTWGFIMQDKPLNKHTSNFVGTISPGSHSSGHRYEPMATPLHLAPVPAASGSQLATEFQPQTAQKPWQAHPSSCFSKKSFSYTSKNLKINGVWSINVSAEYHTLIASKTSVSLNFILFWDHLWRKQAPKTKSFS